MAAAGSGWSIAAPLLRLQALQDAAPAVNIHLSTVPPLPTCLFFFFFVSLHFLLPVSLSQPASFFFLFLLSVEFSLPAMPSLASSRPHSLFHHLFELNLKE